MITYICEGDVHLKRVLHLKFFKKILRDME